jgi:hypothetical protein
LGGYRQVDRDNSECRLVEEEVGVIGGGHGVGMVREGEGEDDGGDLEEAEGDLDVGWGGSGSGGGEGEGSDGGTLDDDPGSAREETPGKLDVVIPDSEDQDRTMNTKFSDWIEVWKKKSGYKKGPPTKLDTVIPDSEDQDRTMDTKFSRSIDFWKKKSGYKKGPPTKLDTVIPDSEDQDRTMETKFSGSIDFWKKKSGYKKGSTQNPKIRPKPAAKQQPKKPKTPKTRKKQKKPKQTLDGYVKSFKASDRSNQIYDLKFYAPKPDQTLKPKSIIDSPKNSKNHVKKIKTETVIVNGTSYEVQKHNSNPYNNKYNYKTENFSQNTKNNLQAESALDSLISPQKKIQNQTAIDKYTSLMESKLKKFNNNDYQLGVYAYDYEQGDPMYNKIDPVTPKIISPLKKNQDFLFHPAKIDPQKKTKFPAKIQKNFAFFTDKSKSIQET